MGIMTGLMRRSRNVDLGHPGGDRPWSELLDGLPSTKSNVTLTEKSAVTLSAVWACARAISEDTAKLPLKTYRSLPDGTKEVLRGHPNTKLLNRKTASYCMAMTFRETLLFHALNWGNGFAEIVRNRAGQAISLHTLTPDRVEIETDGDDLIYLVHNHRRGPSVIGSQDMIHVKGLGFDGLRGYSVPRLARESLGLTAAAEQAGAAFFGSGMRPGGYFKHPGKPSDKARENLKKEMRDQYAGFDKMGKWLLLWENMEAVQLSIDPRDAQFLETRQFQIPEVCRWYRMKPHKIADLSNATYSNIEQQDLEYVGDCLMGWMVRIEQEFWDKLLTEREKEQDFYIEHLVAGLLRGDLKTRYEAYGIGRNWGWLSPNDVLKRENENPLPDGQGRHYLVPSNMVTAESLDHPAPSTGDRSVRLQSLVAGFRPLLEDAIGRILRIEADKAKRADRRGLLSEWADAFYPSHPDHVRAALFPVVETISAAAAALAGATHQGVPASLRAHLDSMALRHSSASREELRGVEAGKIGPVAHRWEGGRAGLDAVHAITELTAAVVAAFETEEPSP
jgi:HK97 family phage portal protein